MSKGSITRSAPTRAAAPRSLRAAPAPSIRVSKSRSGVFEPRITSSAAPPAVATVGKTAASPNAT